MTEAVTTIDPAIAAALVKAQREFGPALKTKQNPHLKSMYADLGAVIEAVIDGLNNNGIMLTQPTRQADGGVSVSTTFLHESGAAYSSGLFFVPAPKNDPQGYGSALTYARRYSLLAACGIAPEDDDGHAAVRTKTEDNVQGWIDYCVSVKGKPEEFRKACADARKAIGDVRDMPGLKRLNAAIGGAA